MVMNTSGNDTAGPLGALSISCGSGSVCNLNMANISLGNFTISSTGGIGSVPVYLDNTSYQRERSDLLPDLNNSIGLLGDNYSLNNENDSYMDDYVYDHTVSSEEMFLLIIWTYVAPTAFGVIILAGLTGNFLILYVFLSKPALQNVTTVLLMNLAISDCSFLLIGVPFTAYKYAAPTWPFGNSFCKLAKYFLYVPVCVNVYTLVAISIVRYLTIVCHNTTTRLRTKQNMLTVIILIWVSMLLLNAPVIMYHEVKEMYAYCYCGVNKVFITPLIFGFFSLAYALPLLLISVIYLMIMFHLDRSKKQSSIDNSKKSGRKDRTSHVARVVFMVILVFGISWLPLHINSILAWYGKLPGGAWYELLRIFWNCMAYGNSCANPFIYTFVSKEFRKAFREVICCAKPTRRRRLYDSCQTASTSEMQSIHRTDMASQTC